MQTLCQSTGVALERLRDIPGYGGRYAITTDGNIWSRQTFPARWIRRYMRDGYLTACLCISGRQKLIAVHRLVAVTYLGAIPDGFVVHHRNGNKLDNRIENLTFATYKENTRHAWDSGLVDVKKNAAHMRRIQRIALGSKRRFRPEMVLDIRLRYSRGESLKSISDFYKAHISTVHRAAVGFTYKEIT